MTPAALGENFIPEVALVNPFDFVGLVAVVAAGQFFIGSRNGRTVYGILILFVYSEMAFAAGFADMGRVHTGIGMPRGQGPMRRMAVAAYG